MDNQNNWNNNVSSSTDPYALEENGQLASKQITVSASAQLILASSILTVQSVDNAVLTANDNLNERWENNVDANVDTIDNVDVDANTINYKAMGKKSLRCGKERMEKKSVKRGQLIKERWLLTRKTWKYMTDAGRRLIPDGVTNRTADDLQKIEEYFQHVCRNEPKFLPWQRKASYPGALTSLRRKRKSKTNIFGFGGSGHQPKASSADEADDDLQQHLQQRLQLQQQLQSKEDGQRLLVMIKMLERFLSIKENTSDQMHDNISMVSDSKSMNDNVDNQPTINIDDRRHPIRTTTARTNNDLKYRSLADEIIPSSSSSSSKLSSTSDLLQSHLLADHRNRAQIKENWFMQSDDHGGSGGGGGGGIVGSGDGGGLGSIVDGGSTNSVFKSSIKFCDNNLLIKGQTPTATIATVTTAAIPTAAIPTARQIKPITQRDPFVTWTAHSALLLENLRAYSARNACTALDAHDRITAEMLHDKRWLRQIRDELKQHQLMRLLRQHTPGSSRTKSSLLMNPIATTTTATTASVDQMNFWLRTTKTTPSTVVVAKVDSDSSIASIRTHRNVTDTLRKTTDDFTTLIRNNYYRYVQTDPIPIAIIYRLYDELIKKKTELQISNKITDNTVMTSTVTDRRLIDDRINMDTGCAKSDNQSQQQTGKHSKRKSSIDNDADVSQSVSDTIKRYLRMARKKGSNTDDANRFKRINYDKYQPRTGNKLTDQSDCELSSLIHQKFDAIDDVCADDGDCTKSTQTDTQWIVDVIDTLRQIECSECSFSPESTDEEYCSSTTTATATPNTISERTDGRISFDYSSPEIDRIKSSSTSPSQSSPPSPSPSGLFHSGTQFLSNLLWSHGHSTSGSGSGSSSVVGDNKHLQHSSNRLQRYLQQQQQQQQQTQIPANSAPLSTMTTATTISSGSAAGGTVGTTTSSITTTSTNTSLPGNSTTDDYYYYNHFFPAHSSTGTAAVAATTTSKMQKSKSSSSVGPSLAKKIWKSRSKSHSRTTSPTKPHWIPQGNCVWTSANGKKIQLVPTPLHELTEIERKNLHRVAVDRINQLNIGVSVSVPNDNNDSGKSSMVSIDAVKAQKKRPMLLKRKARTTGFFDTSKTKCDTNEKGQTSGGRVFGVTLEQCVNNDNKTMGQHDGTTMISSNQISNQQQSPATTLSMLLRRDARNSLTSLLDINRKTAGSYESLPSKGLHFVSLHDDGGGGGADISSTFGQNEIGRKIISSISHTDIRRDSQTDDDEQQQQQQQQQQVAGIQRNLQQQVPVLVTACINHLLKYGLDKVGIFRVSTSKRRVRQLREDFDNGTLTEIDDTVSAHDSASLLKEFLRDLPEPLLCTNLYHAFVQTQKIRNRRLQLEALSHLIQLLPVAHRDTLYVVLNFLATVAKQSDDRKSPITGRVEVIGNKMDSNNLATVIAPNILHLNKLAQPPSESEIMYGLDVINVTRTLIDHFEEIFLVPAEVLDDVYTNMMDQYPEQLNYLCERKNIVNHHQHHENEFLVEPHSQQSSDCNENEQQQRIYARQEFMHENAAIGGGSNGTVRRRERSSKMKYQEPENEQSRLRLRRRDRWNFVGSGDNSGNSNLYASDIPLNIGGASSTTGSIGIAVPFSSSTSTTVTSPSTSMADIVSGDNIASNINTSNNNNSNNSGGGGSNVPTSYLLHNSGIVSATFRLPLHVQIHDNPALNLTTASTIATTVAAVGSDYSNIPYIEDGSSSSAGACSGINSTDQSPATNVFDYTTATTDTNRTKLYGNQSRGIQVHDQMVNQSQLQQQQLKSKVNNNKQQQQQHQLIYDAHHKEPKITASISNIGGAVLRSKTADFERLLKQEPLKKLPVPTIASSCLNLGGSSTGGGNISGGTSNKTTPTPTVSDSSLTEYHIERQSSPVFPTDTVTNRKQRPAQQQIYKRKEIIASVQTTNK